MKPAIHLRQQRQILGLKKNRKQVKVPLPAKLDSLNRLFGHQLDNWRENPKKASGRMHNEEHSP